MTGNRELPAPCLPVIGPGPSPAARDHSAAGRNIA